LLRYHRYRRSDKSNWNNRKFFRYSNKTSSGRKK
jgi:hypothetical protein